MLLGHGVVFTSGAGSLGSQNVVGFRGGSFSPSSLLADPALPLLVLSGWVPTSSLGALIWVGLELAWERSEWSSAGVT